MHHQPTVGLDAQYRVIREECGMLVRGAAAALALSGSDAAEYLHSQLTNEIEALAPGSGCYATLLDRKGRMQADLRVLRVGDGELLLLTEATTLDPLERHLQMYSIGRDVEISRPGSEPVLISLLGPAAEHFSLGAPLGPEHSHRRTSINGIETTAIATDAGVDLICEPADVEALLAALARSGAELIGEEVAELDRIERGRPRFGTEMTTTTIPQEAGINERAVNFEKGCYIGQETVARLHYKGKPNRHLRGLTLDRPVGAGAVVRLDDRELGSVGSVAVSPAFGPIALAILRREAEPGTAVSVGEDGSATVVDTPFR